MKYDTLHESVVKDILDFIDGSDIDELTDRITGNSGAHSISKASSLTKATSGLNLVFPVACTRTIPLETATMISKAVEKKAVSLLQIAFSAFNITNAKDATEFIKNFHTNLKGKISVDDFIDAMDSYANESGLIPKENISMYRAVLEDLRNINYTFKDDISESSINDYNMKTSILGEMVVIKEAKPGSNDLDTAKFMYQRYRDMDQDKKDAARAKRDQDKLDIDSKKADSDIRKANVEILKNQLLPSDVKKANEMVPTMMIVNLITTDKATQSTIEHPIVIGVKAKLYPVDSQDVINKIIVKRVDSNILLKFVKASTREISFVKDFLFAIDNAKLAAIANSKRGSQTNRFLKVLERRALGGKIRKAFKVNNAYKAITTMVISREEADEIYKNGVDVMNPSVIRQIMESLNLMMFIVVDDSEESASIIMDTGDDAYEVLSYTHLEREASDNSSKKIVNLMTKIAR